MGYCGDAGPRGGLKEFFKSSRISSKAFLAQSCLNSHDQFLALVDYRDGGRRAMKGGDGNVVLRSCNISQLCLSCLSAEDGCSLVIASLVLSCLFWVALLQCYCLRLQWRVVVEGRMWSAEAVVGAGQTIDFAMLIKGKWVSQKTKT